MISITFTIMRIGDMTPTDVIASLTINQHGDAEYDIKALDDFSNKIYLNEREIEQATTKAESIWRKHIKKMTEI